MYPDNLDAAFPRALHRECNPFSCEIDFLIDR